MGKKLLLSHTSALTVYRAAGSGLLTTPEELRRVPSPIECTTDIRGFEESANLSALLASGPLDLLARHQDGRHASSGCIIHELGGGLPDGSFRLMGNGICVASPELMFFQLCQCFASGSAPYAATWHKTLVDEYGSLGTKLACAELCSELCGYYSIRPDKTGSFERHVPFVTKEQMLVFLGRLGRRHHKLTAIGAARAAAPTSASPRETSVYLVMTTPWPLGYGFPEPETNKLIFLDGQDPCDEEDCKTARFSDYMWGMKRLRNGRVRRPTTLEYDSDECHTASAGLTDRQLFDQAERRDAIESQGYGYLRLATVHTKNFKAFDAKMRQLARLLRIDLPERSSDEERDACRFQELMFDTLHHKGAVEFKVAKDPMHEAEPA